MIIDVFNVIVNVLFFVFGCVYTLLLIEYYKNKELKIK